MVTCTSPPHHPGTVVSVCLPVHYPPNTVRGVTCVDISMSELTADVTYFKHGQFSYAFIIDGRGRTMLHPLLPDPEKDSPLYLDIHALERDENFQEVIHSMKRSV